MLGLGAVCGGKGAYIGEAAEAKFKCWANLMLEGTANRTGASSEPFLTSRRLVPPDDADSFRASETGAVTLRGRLSRRGWRWRWRWRCGAYTRKTNAKVDPVDRACRYCCVAHDEMVVYLEHVRAVRPTTCMGGGLYDAGWH